MFPIIATLAGLAFCLALSPLHWQSKSLVARKAPWQARSEAFGWLCLLGWLGTIQAEHNAKQAFRANVIQDDAKWDATHYPTHNHKHYPIS